MELFIKCFELLILQENGFLFSRIIFDLTVFLSIAVIVAHYLSKFFKSLKDTAVKDRIAGVAFASTCFNKPHWLKGHTDQYSPNHEGIMLSCERTIDFPGIFCSHMAPGQSFVHLSHPETMAPIYIMKPDSYGYVYNSSRIAFELWPTEIDGLNTVHKSSEVKALKSISDKKPPKDKLVYGFLEPWIGNGLLRSNGSYWHRHRRLLTPAFHFNILKFYIPKFNACAREMLENFDAVKDQPIEVFEPVALLTLDTMLQCAMSTVTHCQSSKNHPYVEAIHTLSDAIVQRSSKIHLMFNWIFKLSAIGRAFRKALKVVHSFTDKIIADRRKVLESASSPTAASDDELNYHGGKLINFLDILLTVEDENGIKLTDEEIREEVDTFLFEGHDTTASGISWTFYMLAKHPDYQARCRDEIVNVMGDSEDVDWNDLSKLEYLTMCIKESLRLYPPVPITIRELNEELPIPSSYNISGESIPKGSYVCLNLWSMHRNRHIWDKPDDFNPERFSKENIVKMAFNTFLPFSAGSRNCIGQNFAMNEMKVVLAQTLRRFRLSIDDSSPEPRLVLRLVLSSETGIHIKFSSL